MVRVVSLFTGCAGLDSGFIAGGHDVVAAFDHDPAAVATYNRNFASVAKCRDLTNDLDETIKAEIVLAGPPCQGFSPIGALHPNDKRNTLFAAACRHAVKVAPKLIVIENVPGIQSKANAPLLEQGKTILVESGYHVEIVAVHCEELGVAQRRRRIFLIARSDSRPFSLNLRPQPKLTVGDVFRNLKNPEVQSAKWLEQGSKAWMIARKIKQGQKLSDVRASDKSVHSWQVPEVFGDTDDQEQAVLRAILRLRRVSRSRATGDGDPVSIARICAEMQADVSNEVRSLLEKGYLKECIDGVDMARTFNGTFRRLALDSPSPTVDTHFLSPRLFLHPTEPRGMSYAEAAAIQGFPESFSWPSSAGVRTRQIGNAVPPPVSSALARSASELL